MDQYKYERLREAREHRGLTQREVASDIGVTVQTYQSWESGRTEPRASQVAALALLFRKRLGFLYVA